MTCGGVLAIQPPSPPGRAGMGFQTLCIRPSHRPLLHHPDERDVGFHKLFAFDLAIQPPSPPGRAGWVSVSSQMSDIQPKERKSSLPPNTDGTKVLARAGRRRPGVAFAGQPHARTASLPRKRIASETTSRPDRYHGPVPSSAGRGRQFRSHRGLRPSRGRSQGGGPRRHGELRFTWKGDRADPRLHPRPATELKCFFGRNIPCGTTPFLAMKSPGDKMLDAPAFQQFGVELLLDTLRRSPQPCEITVFGSARSVAVALNRQPDLLRGPRAADPSFRGHVLRANTWNGTFRSIATPSSASSAPSCPSPSIPVPPRTAASPTRRTTAFGSCRTCNS